MKVICVNNKNLGFGDCPELTEGKEYKVTDVWSGRWSGIEYYSINGFNCVKGEEGFHSVRFIPLSEIDEMELLKEREQELINA